MKDKVMRVMRSRAGMRLALWASLPICAVAVFANIETIGSARGAARSALIAPVATPSGEVEMKAFWDSEQPGTKAAPQLRQGYLADYRDWPASLYVTFQTPLGTAACTAALIGPEVMLTAAHCVPASGQVSFTLSNRRYSTTCTQHPQYRQNQDASADYALCRLAEPFAPPANTGFMYDTVDLGAMSARLGNPIVLTGFGCTSDTPGVPSTDGRYRYGFNTVVETSESPPNPAMPELYSDSEDNNLFTEYKPNSTQQIANLCPGDSGGPAYRRTGADITERLIVGVNSRVFYADASHTKYGASLISSTGTSEFRDWARTWLNEAKVQACGIVAPPAPIRCRP